MLRARYPRAAQGSLKAFLCFRFAEIIVCLFFAHLELRTMLEGIQPEALNNAKEQYQALGFFVAAFESMVEEVRGSCVQILRRDTDRETIHRRLLEVPFYHRSMTAGPLFDILQALIADILKDSKFRDEHHISDKDREIFTGVLGRINGEYTELSSKRNNLLHGTWFIGYSSAEDAVAERFHIKRYTTSAEGLIAVKEMPKTAPELIALGRRCNSVRQWVSILMNCLPQQGKMPDFKIADRFRLEGKTWHHVHFSGSISTLPHKLPIEQA